MYPRIGHAHLECAIWHGAALAAVQSSHPDVVLMGSTMTDRFTLAQWTADTTP